MFDILLLINLFIALIEQRTFIKKHQIKGHTKEV